LCRWSSGFNRRFHDDLTDFEGDTPLHPLAPDQFALIHPLVRQAEITSHLLLARSLIQGTQRGAIFVDRPTAPTVALVCPNDGFYFVFGDAGHPAFPRFIPELLANHLVEKPAIYATSGAWKETLDRLFTERTLRFGFEYRPEERLLPADWRDQTPSEFTPEPMDETVIDKWQDGIDPWIIEIWGGPETFAARSFGYALVNEGKIASFCALGCREGTNAEIEVGTVPRFRNRGLAALACAAFLEECELRGLLPAWTCDSRNVASKTLARKLGFILNEEVFGYSLDASYECKNGVWGPPDVPKTASG
jgi:RimJ/RimL family protein N-acetyltransferase